MGERTRPELEQLVTDMCDRYEEAIRHRRGGRRWKASVAYLRSHTGELDLPGEIEEYREDLIQYGVKQLTGESADPNDSLFVKLVAERFD